MGSARQRRADLCVLHIKIEKPPRACATRRLVDDCLLLLAGDDHFDLVDLLLILDIRVAARAEGLDRLLQFGLLGRNTREGVLLDAAAVVGHCAGKGGLARVDHHRASRRRIGHLHRRLDGKGGWRGDDEDCQNQKRNFRLNGQLNSQHGIS